MMFSIPDKPNVCPVCGSEPQATYDGDKAAEFRCGAVWEPDWTITKELRSQAGWVVRRQCGWATPIALELLAGKIYDPSVPRFKQVDL